MGRLTVIDDVVLGADEGATAVLGRPRATLEGSRLSQLMTPGSRLYWHARHPLAPGSAPAHGITLGMVTPDGTEVPVVVDVDPEPAALPASGRARATVTVTLADGAHAPSAVRDAERRAARLGAYFNANPDPVIVVDARGRVLEWNDAAAAALGTSRADAIGADAALLLSGGSPLRYRSLVGAITAPVRGPQSGTAVDVSRADGAVVPVDLGVGTDEVDGERVTVLVIRERVATDSPSGAVTTAGPGPDGSGPLSAGGPEVVVMGIDPSGAYDFVEGSSPLLRGRAFDDLVGRQVRDVLAADGEALAALGGALEGRTVRLETSFAGRDWQVVFRPRRGTDGTQQGALIVSTDVTDLHALQAEMRRRSVTDPLTGLLNRTGLHEALESDLAAPGGHVALVQLDLDGFTDLNDSLGHTVGDAVLVEVAHRLVLAAPAGAVVARHGGDEFAVVLGAGVHDQPDLVARRLVREISGPVTVGPDEHVVAVASVGISRWPHDAADGAELLAHADVATRRAKATPGQVATYDERRDDPRSRFRLLGRLRKALAARELDVHYQPVVALADGRLTSVEALVRWTDATLGPVSPLDLVAAAESARLIDDVGAIVLDRACAQLRAWDAAGFHVPRVAVNVSPLQLRGGRLLPELDAALDRHGVPAERLTVEVTESAVAGLDDTALRVLRRVRARGVLVALDDFGTGHSSLARLRDLPVDVVKLDRSFVTGLPGTVPTALVRAFVGVASALGLGTVAEGVETAEERDVLIGMGCSHAQGYLFARPAPGDLLGS